MGSRFYNLPSIGGNPSSLNEGTNPGSFAARPDVGGPKSFSSPDTPGMPEPSTVTAENWSQQPGVQPVTQLEHARAGTITPEMRRVAEREGGTGTPLGIRVHTDRGVSG